ncbi:serine/threonine-protein kinase YPK2/YKR2 [Tirmania nivea]|nr:serine/threonine-protein kinase YPK2/YKR2 [Tirmania nivea]
MSASQIIIMRGPEQYHTEPYHCKPVELTQQKASQTQTQTMKPDLIKLPLNENALPEPVKPDEKAPPDPAKLGEKTPLDPVKPGEDDRRVKLNSSNFEFITTLGTGTFARVWLVKPTKEVRGRVSTSQVYALKVLRKVDIIRLKQCEHTKSERRILYCCRKHPFIAQLVYSWSDWNSLYLLMEYAPGGELFTYLRRLVRFPVSMTQFYTAEIASAFCFLHRNGVVYRDLKPENVMIDAHGHIRLVDFGFSKEIGNYETYTLCGTPEYIAPEILLSKGHGKAVDWWALGVFIFELSCGYPPFYDANTNKMYEKILKADIHFPSSLDLPEAYKDIVRKLCTRDLTARLGNLRGGGNDVKKHPFFSDIDWDELEKKTHPGPLAPDLENPEDASYFEPYAPPEERDPDDYTIAMYDRYENYFRDF